MEIILSLWLGLGLLFGIYVVATEDGKFGFTFGIFLVIVCILVWPLVVIDEILESWK